MTVSNPKYLVVDDEIVKQKQKEAFVKPMSLPFEAAIFAETYEEALEILKSNSNIILCLVDLRIPLNKQDKYKKEEDGQIKKWIELAKEELELKNENGIKLIQEIKVDTYIFSAYAEEELLEQIASLNKIVKGYFEKPYNAEEIKAKIGYYAQKFVSNKNNISSLSKSFDYSSLDKETSSFIQSRTFEIKKLIKRSVEDIINIGNNLIEVKERLGFGNFYDWLEVEFNWTSRTAVRFMSVAQRFNSDNVSDLNNILPSALYQLAAPSTPDEAVTEALERAKVGETIDPKTAQAIKSKYKAKAKEKETESIITSSNPEQAEKISTKFEQIARPKQKILSVVPSQNAVKNSWWQLGENHRLFCGEPKNKDFIKSLPKDIALIINFLPKRNFSLIPSVSSIFSFTLHSEYSDLDIDSLIAEAIKTSTKPKEMVLFNYIYYAELLELVEKFQCYFWIAEPDLNKCQEILTIWREKGKVERIFA
ncbi:MAG: DUF3102 domain-containing protein [Xenococcaceae cyanobacterium]